MLDKGCTGASSRGRARAHDAVVHAQNGAQLALHKRLYAPPPAGGRRRRRAQLSAACARARLLAVRGHAAHVTLLPVRLEGSAECQRQAPARPAATGLADAHSGRRILPAAMPNYVVRTLDSLFNTSNVLAES